MKQPLVSIIIPVYNVSKYIAQCLDSVLSQTYDNIEVLLIDDRGNDDSMAVVERILASYNGDKIVRVIAHEQNRGLSAARNTGTANAHGQYLMYVDSDDYLASDDVMDKFVDTAIATHADIVCANSIMFDDINGKIIPTVARKCTDSNFDNSEGIYGALLPGTVWNMLIEREYLIRNNIYFDEGIYYEDDIWTFKIECCGYRLATLSLKSYMYRCRGGSILNTLNVRHIVSSALLPLLSARWVTENPDNASHTTHAVRGLLNMMQGGLLKAMGKTTDASLFNRLYNIYRNNPHLRHRLSPAHIRHSRLLTRSERFRAYAYNMPTPIGRAAYRWHTSRIIHDRRLGPTFNNLPCIDVPADITDQIISYVKK